MGITGSLIIFVLIWWIVFFSILPVGIKSENKKFEAKIQGNDAGAPKNPNIGKKFLITTKKIKKTGINKAKILKLTVKALKREKIKIFRNVNLLIKLIKQ